MRSSDIAVLECDVGFRSVQLKPPLALSHGAIERFTVSEVRLVAADRSGRSAAGRGSSVLSVPWAWPHPSLSVVDRDDAMRELCRQLAQSVVDAPAADPIRWWCELEAALPREAGSMPRLAALLCLGAVDSALHDAWARVAGRPAYAMYDAHHLTDDLGAVLDPALKGSYPGDFLRPARAVLPVQHLVSADDPLTDKEATGAARSLQSWLHAERIRHLKIKLLGRDPEQDAERTAAVHRAALRCTGPASIAVDPNEGYTSAEQVTEFVRALRRNHPETAAVLSYIEQPVPRGTAIAAGGEPIPILMDEGLGSLDTLPTLAGTGWGGIVIKAGKGQTHALLAHSYARFNDLFLTVQDLTAVDLAFRHSARLASLFGLSAEHLEYNSRQYAAHANSALTRTHPELTTVRDGMIRIDPVAAPGIY